MANNFDLAGSPTKNKPFGEGNGAFLELVAGWRRWWTRLAGELAQGLEEPNGREARQEADDQRHRDLCVRWQSGAADKAALLGLGLADSRRLLERDRQAITPNLADFIVRLFAHQRSSSLLEAKLLDDATKFLLSAAANAVGHVRVQGIVAAKASRIEHQVLLVN
eukprot:CAMPEP_0205818432 /NCGR_PEP_ID=MMETSP0206-20130828/342_1 /ASSEMBLY_ACC=CAM_ASM_000279 /TAXON_ID=36767 /ORGANISM="Euplotes focardii, Strain TN1" /LENGTH=164 /DNA_ID=CAMNT_0053110791 /DNA_START=64 /DNA_END=558 /DNA_ORIENTATION=+